MANEVRASGSALLAALEKGDAEHMAQLRSTHEVALLNATRKVRKWQVEEARLTLKGLKQTRETAEIRRKFYENNLEVDLNPSEQNSLDLTSASLFIRCG